MGQSAIKKRPNTLNVATLNIARYTSHKRLVLYVWVALVSNLHEGKTILTYKELAQECKAKPENVRDALQWLEDNGYIVVNKTTMGQNVYALA